MARVVRERGYVVVGIGCLRALGLNVMLDSKGKVSHASVEASTGEREENFMQQEAKREEDRH